MNVVDTQQDGRTDRQTDTARRHSRAMQPWCSRAAITKWEVGSCEVIKRTLKQNMLYHRII